MAEATTKCVMCNGIGKHLTGAPVAGATVNTTNCGFCGGTGQVPLQRALELDRVMNPSAPNLARDAPPAPSATGTDGAGEASSVMAAFKTTGSAVTKQFLAAGKQELASEVAHAMLAATKATMGASWPAILDTKAGEAAILTLLPAVTMFACELWPQIPYAGLLQKGSTLALQGSAQIAVKESFEIIKPVLNQVAIAIAGVLQARLATGELGALMGGQAKLDAGAVPTP